MEEVGEDEKLLMEKRASEAKHLIDIAAVMRMGFQRGILEQRVKTVEGMLTSTEVDGKPWRESLSRKTWKEFSVAAC